MIETEKFKKLLIVIPTRNRADFAVRAIKSVLEQEGCSFEVIVSDNSTEEAEVHKLSAFCEQLNDNRLNYIKPPKPLPMTEHWDWAMHQALELSQFSHISYLSDRTLFLKSRLQSLEKILIKYSDKVVSYRFDKLKDTGSPILLFQPLQTGKVFEVKSALILKFYADVERIEVIPKMVNCVAPRAVVTAVKEKTGSYFSSVAPDYNFAFNCLDIVDSILFYDSPLLLSYGIAKSSGKNVLEGTFQKDSLDFIKNMNISGVGFDTPVKSYLLVANAITHEYIFGKQSSKSSKFPEMNRKKYNLSLVDNVTAYKNLEMKKEMLTQMRSSMGFRLPLYSIYSKIQRKMQGLRVKLFNLLNPSNPYLKITNFENIEQAIEFANYHPRENTSDYSFIIERIGSLPSRNGNVKVLREKL